VIYLCLILPFGCSHSVIVVERFAAAALACSFSLLLPLLRNVDLFDRLSFSDISLVFVLHFLLEILLA